MHQQIQSINQGRSTVPNKLKAGVICGVLACTLGVTSATAYLTATDSVSNPFSLGTNLSISLTEPAFAAENAKGVLPDQTVAKDPTVTNTGAVSAYIAADVKVPTFSGQALVNGEAKTLTDADLFTYALNEGWTKVGDAVTADGFRTYRYVFSDVVDAGKAAAPIFDEVTLANLTGDVGISETSIDITAYAIQSEGFTSATDALGAYDTQAQAVAKA